MEWWEDPEGIFDSKYPSDFEVLADSEFNKKQADFIIQALRLKKEESILDVCGGFGRHAVEFARRGYMCTLLDINGHFLEMAQRMAQKAGVRLNVKQCDIRNIPAAPVYRAAVCMATSFGYFDDEQDHVKALGAVAGCLSTGGEFVLDLDNRERTIKYFSRYQWHQTTDGFVLRESEINLFTGRMDERIIRVKTATQEVRENVISIRHFSLNEITSIGRKAGLKMKKVYGDYNLNDYCIDSPRMILIFEKLTPDHDESLKPVR